MIKIIDLIIGPCKAIMLPCLFPCGGPLGVNSLGMDRAMQVCVWRVLNIQQEEAGPAIDPELLADCWRFAAGGCPTPKGIQYSYSAHGGAPQGSRQGNIIAQWGPNEYPFNNRNAFLLNIYIYIICDWYLDVTCQIKCCCC